MIKDYAEKPDKDIKIVGTDIVITKVSRFRDVSITLNQAEQRFLLDLIELVDLTKDVDPG